jgi:hypothetical protein
VTKAVRCHDDAIRKVFGPHRPDARCPSKTIAKETIMSAPTTNVERQATRHRGPIWGILAALLFGGIMGAAITIAATDGSAPSGSDVQIDGRTGAVEQSD